MDRKIAEFISVVRTYRGLTVTWTLAVLSLLVAHFFLPFMQGIGIALFMLGAVLVLGASIRSAFVIARDA